ncbi:MAG: tetratricopeptide repeat protein [Fibrella sp.]|nr:tetratricopeptide repeat protein [Armatimonadota bacterium]
MIQNRSRTWLQDLFSFWCAAFTRTSHRKRVLLAAHCGDYGPLLQNAELALNQTFWHYGADHPETARKIAALAAIHALREEISQADPLYRRAIAILSHSHDATDRAEALTLLEQLADLLAHNHDTESAQKIYLELLSRFGAIHEGHPHEDIARTLDNLALVLKSQGRIAVAKENHRNALLIWEAVCGPGSPEVARCLTHLASLYLSEQLYEEAEPLLLRAVAAWKSSPNPHDLYAIITLSCCGDLYRSTGRGEEARDAEDAAKAVLARYAK